MKKCKEEKVDSKFEGKVKEIRWEHMRLIRTVTQWIQLLKRGYGGRRRLKRKIGGRGEREGKRGGGGGNGRGVSLMSHALADETSQ